MKQKPMRAAVLLLLLFYILGSGLPVLAIGDASLYATTPYTGLLVSPGQKYEFEVSLENKTQAISQVELSVTELPQGWSAYFDYSGKNVTDLFIKPEGNLYARFVVTIPDDTPDGLYHVTTTYSDDTGHQDITYKLTVQSEPTGASLRGKLDVQFPELTGPSGAVFSYRVTYYNDNAANQSFSLATSAPGDGWNVTFQPLYESKTVASIVVDAYGSQVLDVEVTPPANVEAGNYTVGIALISETETITTDLLLEIQGAYGLQVTTPDGRLNTDAYAGKETAMSIQLNNTGTAVLRDISLDNLLPAEWSASFEPAVLAELQPGDAATVELRFQPARRAVTGDYVLSVIGANYGVRSEAEIRVTVKTPVYWGFIGLACIAAILVLLWWVFRKFGRR